MLMSVLHWRMCTRPLTNIVDEIACLIFWSWSAVSYILPTNLVVVFSPWHFYLKEIHCSGCDALPSTYAQLEFRQHLPQNPTRKDESWEASEKIVKNCGPHFKNKIESVILFRKNHRNHQPFCICGPIFCGPRFLCYTVFMALSLTVK